jgi:hypothetical protein
MVMFAYYGAAADIADPPFVRSFAQTHEQYTQSVGMLERDGHLSVTVPETVETTAEQLAPALAAV